MVVIGTGTAGTRFINKYWFSLPSDSIVEDLEMAINGYVIVSSTTTSDGDYAGSTDTAIQQGIDEALSSGKRLLIRKGIYTISNTLTINGHLQIFGEGNQATVLKAANGFNSDLIHINSTQAADTHYRPVFQDIGFDGNNANNTDGSLIVGYGIIQSIFFRCHFTDFYDYGLHLWDCGGGSGAYGHHNQIVNCLFDSSEDSGGEGIGIYMRNNDENVIIGSQFQYCKLGVKDQTGFNTISDCAFVDGHDGIYILDCSRTGVNNCVFDYCAKRGIHLKGAFNNISNNRFYNISDGNTNTYSAIYIEWYGTNNIIGNTIYAHETSGTTKAAIEEAGNASEDTYGNNLLTGNLCLSATGATSLANNSFGTSAFIEANTNNKSNNFNVLSSGTVSLQHQPRWIAPLHGNFGIAATNQAAGTVGRVFTQLFEVNEQVTIDSISYIIGSTAAGNVNAALYGPVVSEETPDGSAFIVASGDVAQSGTNTEQALAITPTTLKPGRYYVCIQFSDATATYIRQGNQTQVVGWTGYVDLGSYTTFPATYGTMTATPSAMPAIKLRCE